MEMWGIKTLKSSSKRLEQLNTARLIVYIKQSLSMLFNEKENEIDTLEFEENVVLYENITLQVIINICEKAKYDIKLIETSINYETKNIDVVLTLVNDLEVSFYKE